MERGLLPHYLSFLIFFIVLPLYALDLPSLCPFCNKGHLGTSPEVFEHAEEKGIVIELGIFEQAALEFPCLREKLMQAQAQGFLPQRDEESLTIENRGRGDFILSPEHVIALCFLSNIRLDNGYTPFTEKDFNAFSEKLAWEAYTKKWLGWRPIALFMFFSLGGALSNYFNFISIYNTPDPNFPNVTQLDTNASLGVQNLFIAGGAFLFGFLGSAASLVWTGHNQDTLRDYTGRLHITTHRIREEYLDLCRALIILYFSYPNLAESIANNFDAKAMKRGINYYTGDEIHSVTINFNNLLSVIDYIKSHGQHWPATYELQLFIKLVKKMF